MKIGVVISQTEAETVWNALRFANFSLQKNHSTKVFFMGKGVEYQNIEDEKFNVQEQAEKFLENGGEIFACGSCIILRNQKESDVCPISTMQDLMDIVEESDKILTF